MISNVLFTYYPTYMVMRQYVFKKSFVLARGERHWKCDSFRAVGTAFAIDVSSTSSLLFVLASIMCENCHRTSDGMSDDEFNADPRAKGMADRI